MNVFKPTKKNHFLIKSLKFFLVIFFLFGFYPLTAIMSPDKPSNTSPSNAATGVSLTPTLTSSSYANPFDSATASDGVVDRVGSADFTGLNLASGDFQSAHTAGGVSGFAADLSGGTKGMIDDPSTLFADTKATNRTISCWVRYDTAISGNGQYTIIRFRENSGSTFSGFWAFRIFRHNTQTSNNHRLSLQRRVENGESFSPATVLIGNTNLAINTWYMATITTNGSAHSMFVNATSQTISPSSTDASGDWWGNTYLNAANTKHAIGVQDNGILSMEGQIDECTYWNKELSSTEITELYNSGTPINPRTHSASANLVNYWPIGENVSHKASQWQITTTSADYSSPIYDSGTDESNLTSLNVPGGTLSEGITYYWRVRHQDEKNNWSTWSDETSFTTESSGSLSVDILDSSDISVGSPSVSMNAIDFSFINQSTNGTLGTSSEKIRVENPTGSSTWTLSLAAEDGSTALWSSGTDFYDFNDPTANAEDGADVDSYGGQMTIDPSSSTITPAGGCTLSNISSGSSSSFNEGVTDSITLASATSGADTNCHWDITGIDISQTIPAEQPAGNYAIDMTLSIVAS